LSGFLPVSDGLERPPLWHKFDTNLPQAAKADRITASYGTRECRDFRQRIFNDLHPIATDLAQRYAKTAERFDYIRANLELLEIHRRLRVHDLNLCASTEELREAAERYAQKCQQARQAAKNESGALAACLEVLGRYGIDPPKLKEDGFGPVLNRLCCPRWWSRKIRVLSLRTLEEIARNIALVNKCRSTYASDYTVHLKRQQKQRNREYLESATITNENGESFTLQELADRSVSNPAIRRGELMVRIKGFEIVAELAGHVGEFYTLTTPSRMHACLHNGAENPRHDRTTPLQAHEYLIHLWALIRAELHRQGIQPYGFRVVEPHHDGTPHWHLLLFLPAEHRETTREIMRRYALADSGDEPGAQKHRFKAVAIEPAKGTAAGYIAKYISKNIDGHALEKDLYGKDAQQAAEHITAWANTWGIRQFQQIGGPSVTVWRQLRRLEKADDEDLEAIRQTATASDWAAFMLAMGGPEIPRNAQALDHSRQLIPDTGEIVLTLKSRYGDEAPLRVAGLVWRGNGYDTRKHFWTLPSQGNEAGRDGCAGVGAHRPDPPQLPAIVQRKAWNTGQGAAIRQSQRA